MADYGLIIIDDEEMMRDGLSSLIRWGDLGFHLDGVFEDGSDAMEWLGENYTHVILTDLKMTHASGLDVASFVREKKLDTKIVIISGYSDFEAAQKALGFQIREYLLKPISAKTIREVFGRLKEELDGEGAELKAISEEIESFESLKSYVEERFISQLVLGGFRRPEELKQQLKLMKWDQEVLSRPCVLFSLSISQESDAAWEYESSDRDNLIGGMISRLVAPSRFFWYRTTRVDLAGIIMDCSMQDDLNEEIHGKLESVIEQAKSLAVDIALMRIQTYDSLGTFAQNTEPITPAENGDAVHVEQEDMQRLIISHIMENQEGFAVELLDAYMELLRLRSWDSLINGLVDLITNINGTFSSMKAVRSNPGIVSFADFFSLKTREAVYEWTRETIRSVLNLVQHEAPGNRMTLIIRAKKYIDANFSHDITLTHVAEHVNLSPVYFSRLFKEQTGENFSDYLISCRIHEACQLLRESKKKVYEICDAVGYKDLKHFYGLFKREVGCTPSEYRHG